MIFSNKRPAVSKVQPATPSMVPPSGMASQVPQAAGRSLRSMLLPSSPPAAAAQREMPKATIDPQVEPRSARAAVFDTHQVVPTAVASPRSTAAGTPLNEAAPTSARPLLARAPVEITSLDAVPAGNYMPFEQLKPEIPEKVAEHMVLLKTGISSVIVLLTNSFRVSHLFFDATERLKKNGLTYEVVAASHQVIAALHDQSREAGNDAEDATRDEQFAWELIESAIRKQASDIHIETNGAQAKVLFRIHGERVLQPSMASRTANAICSTLYNVHADAQNKDTQWDSKQVQDTVIDKVIGGAACQIRFHTAPIHPSGSFHCVMRLLLMSGQSTKPIEEIGYTDAQAQKINEALSGSSGLFVTVGAVNAGKSTSMQAYIARLRERRGPLAKIVTVEDPVEYVIPGACQMGIPKGRSNLVDKDSDSIYTTFLKATLREDTDVAMLGEIRGVDSASTVKDLVLTGRKTLSTLHVYEAFATFARLRELGVPESLLTTHGFISAIVFQKLLPTLCPHCCLEAGSARLQMVLPHGLTDRLAVIGRTHSLEGVRFRNPHGCSHCSETGIVGRSMCAEIIVPDERLLSMLRSGDLVGAKEHWLGTKDLNVEGLGVTALAHAASKMLRGEVDPREVENQLGLLSLLQPHGPSIVQLPGHGKRQPDSETAQQSLVA